jgi:hypothetical protein
MYNVFSYLLLAVNNKSIMHSVFSYLLLMVIINPLWCACTTFFLIYLWGRIYFHSGVYCAANFPCPVRTFLLLTSRDFPQECVGIHYCPAILKGFSSLNFYLRFNLTVNINLIMQLVSLMVITLTCWYILGQHLMAYNRL